MAESATKSKPYPTAMFSRKGVAPREPTPAMITLGAKLIADATGMDVHPDGISAIWRAMHDEATKG